MRVVRVRSDVIGNNLHFNSESSMKHAWMEDENDRLTALIRSRNIAKRNLATTTSTDDSRPK
jgi:hypothetical protein